MVSIPDLVMIPKPNGTSPSENITTPVFSGIPSLILTTYDLIIWFPYKKLYSADLLITTLYVQY